MQRIFKTPSSLREGVVFAIQLNSTSRETDETCSPIEHFHGQCCAQCLGSKGLERDRRCTCGVATRRGVLAWGTQAGIRLRRIWHARVTGVAGELGGRVVGGWGTHLRCAGGDGEATGPGCGSSEYSHLPPNRHQLTFRHSTKCTTFSPSYYTSWFSYWVYLLIRELERRKIMQ